MADENKKNTPTINFLEVFGLVPNSPIHKTGLIGVKISAKIFSCFGAPLKVPKREIFDRSDFPDF
jgi:hypothetical protein